MRGAGLAMDTTRVEWVDYAKGLCIIMVVMMHSTLDYGAAVGEEGWLHHVVTFARSFRMPDFFLLAGLFLAGSIHSPLRDYLDRKLVHFVYFYLLWLAIQLGVTEAGLLLSQPLGFVQLYAQSLIFPVNTLWFVHMLAIFYVVTRLLRKLPVWWVLIAAAALQTSFRAGWLDTDWSVTDRFMDRYVYFFAGYALAPWIFRLANQVISRPGFALAGLSAWALVNGWLTSRALDELPLISLALGFAGAAAIVSIGSLMTRSRIGDPIRYAGANSIVIYLTFFFPMKVMIRLLESAPWNINVGFACLVITVIAVITPLLFHYGIRTTPLMFLYRRPALFRLDQRVPVRGPA